MAFIPVPNTAEVQVRGTLSLQKVENTLWFEATGGWDGDSLATLAGDIQTWVRNHLAPLLSQNWSLRETFAKDMSTPAGAEHTAVPGAPIAGLLTPALPGNVTLAVSFRTAKGGRSFRGRNYIMGIPNGVSVNQNFVPQSYADQLSAAYQMLTDPSIITVGKWVIASRFSGVAPGTGKPIPRASGIVTPVVTAVVTDLVVDSQRRRLPGRGQ